MPIMPRVFGSTRSAWAAAWLLWSAPATAQQSAEPFAADDLAGATSSAPAASSRDARPDGAPLDTRKGEVSSEITFTGYQSLADGRGIVFVEMSEPVTVEVTRSGQVVEYRLLGARVPLKNNKNPLLLRDFNSSAVTAVLVADKKSVRLVITLRGAVSPVHRMVSRGKGAALEVELPAPPSR
jgi:hypothetical protein